MTIFAIFLFENGYAFTGEVMNSRGESMDTMDGMENLLKTETFLTLIGEGTVTMIRSSEVKAFYIMNNDEGDR